MEPPKKKQKLERTILAEFAISQNLKCCVESGWSDHSIDARNPMDGILAQSMANGCQARYQERSGFQNIRREGYEECCVL